MTQPWASMVAQGEKSIETRRWVTPYRGALLVCATKERVPDFPGPYGVALAVVWMAGCRPMRAEDWPAACCTEYPGAFAWLFPRVAVLAEEHRFAVRGQLGVFRVQVPAPHAEAVLAAIRRVEVA